MTTRPTSDRPELELENTLSRDRMANSTTFTANTGRGEASGERNGTPGMQRHAQGHAQRGEAADADAPVDTASNGACRNTDVRRLKARYPTDSITRWNLCMNTARIATCNSHPKRTGNVEV